jgi:glycosyltransferase involved in cell wall biosynthesis
MEQIIESENSRFKRLRIAHFHSTLGVYGAERWTAAIIKHLNNDKFESTVVTVGTKPGADLFARTVRSEGFLAHHIPLPGKLNPSIVVALRSFLAQNAFDILHTHGFKADVLGYLATRASSVKLVSTIHGWTPNEGGAIRAYEAISRIFLKRFDRIYPLSPALCNDLIRRKFEPSKVQLILNGVDLSDLEFKENARIESDPIIFLFVGRLCKPKGIFELLRAFSSAQLRVPARLRIAGDGPERDELERLCEQLGISDKVDFLGQVPKVAPLFKTSHVLVLPSHSEGIPRVIMESFASGVPVIGTAIPGIQQLIKHEHSGLLVDVDNVASLSDALERISQSPKLGREMALRAREIVTTKYSAVRMATELGAEYAKLCPN